MIDLDKIIEEYYNGWLDDDNKESIKDCMKEAIRQALELAVENPVYKIEGGNFDATKTMIDMESILNVMNKIK